MKVRRLGIGLELISGKFKLAIDPPKGYKGFSIFSGTYPIEKKSDGGSYGPFKWEVVELRALRNKINAFLIDVEDMKILYAGGSLEVPKRGYDVLALASGGTWYMDPFKACKTFRESEAKIFIPTALWKPGISLPLEGLEEIRDRCRSLRRLRGKYVGITKLGEKTILLLE